MSNEKDEYDDELTFEEALELLEIKKTMEETIEFMRQSRLRLREI